MTKVRCLGFCCTALLALMLASTANAELYLMFNVGDNEDSEAADAATTQKDAQDGTPPKVIDSEAERYFVHLPGATMDTLSGSATRVGEDSPDDQVAMMVEAVSESAGGAAAAGESEEDAGWVEYEANAASLMLFSPDGLDQESDVRFEPARVFLRRSENGSVIVMITGRDGDSPTTTTE